MVPDLEMPMIAARDIADVAARALKARDWTGVVVRELLGPRDLTYAEATRIIGAHIGKPDLQYVQFPYADFAASLAQMGISRNVAVAVRGDGTSLQRRENQVARWTPAGEHDPDQVRGFRRGSGSCLPGGMREVPQSEPTGQASPSTRNTGGRASIRRRLTYSGLRRRIPEPSDRSRRQAAGVHR